MKILHSADWHIGAKNLRLPQQSQQLIKDEMLMNIQELFRKAKSESYDVVLICGDLFHSKTISQRIISLFFKAVEDFLKPVIYIDGNHDSNLILNHAFPSNFVYMNKENYKFEYLDTVFYSAVYSDTLLDEQKNNILLLHGNIENKADNDYLDLTNYLLFPFDYIALGHIHQFKKYKKGDRIFAYSGSLFSNGFDECGDKGFLEVNINNKKIEKLNFVPFAFRRYMLCECDITNLQDNYQIISAVEGVLTENCIAKNDLIRVVLTGAIDENAEKSLEIIKSSFDDYFYFELQDKSTLKIDIEKVKREKLSFKYEFLSLVENSDLNDDDKRKICEIGLEALKGEGLNL